MGNELKHIVEYTTRHETDASTSFSDGQPLIHGSSAIGARIFFAKHFSEWVVRSPGAETWIKARSLQLGSQNHAAYDHISGSITSPEVVSERLCKAGIGSTNNHERC